MCNDFGYGVPGKKEALFSQLFPVCLFGIIGILCAVFACREWPEQHAERQRVYLTWCKHTGNPKQLNYKEWRRLKLEGLLNKGGKE